MHEHRVIPFAADGSCFHGGAFFAAIGEEFDRLERRRDVVNADVLDAWFPPSPRALAALREALPWILRTSPPTRCEGLLRVIARERDVPIESLVPGGGSSDLIWRAFSRWTSPRTRALVLDPAYGEYAHALAGPLRCRVERFVLHPEHDFRVDLPALAAAIERGGFDLVVLVNPNNPTGRHVPRRELEPFLRALPSRTRVWIDEAYVDYVDAGESLESFAAASRNVVVCKSLSKGLALSGARAAYLVAPPPLAADLRAITPPWVVSLPAQVAAVAALQDRDHYAACYAETARLRARFVARLAAIAEPVGARVDAALANWVLLHLERDGPTAADVVSACARRGVFLRDAGATSAAIGPRVVRIAVRRPAEQRRILSAITETLSGLRRSRVGRVARAQSAG
jgi:histidinol-phosphate/aromatic aminotransferase/cobyric acid decarboxylase-like protein